MTGANRKLVVGGVVAATCIALGIGDGVVNHAFALQDLILGGLGVVFGAAPTLYENVSFKGAGFEANVVSARETSDAIGTATDAAAAAPLVRGDAGDRPQLPSVAGDAETRRLTLGETGARLALPSADRDDVAQSAESAAVEDEAANPVAQFAVLRVAIERELLAIAQLAGVAAPRPRPPSWWVNRLRELEIFEPPLAAALFRVLRVANKAIHGQVDPEAGPIIATSGPELLRSIQGLRFNHAYLGRIIAARAGEKGASPVPTLSISYIEYVGGDSEVRLQNLTISVLPDDAVRHEVSTLKPGDRRIVASPRRPESVGDGVPLVWVDRTAPRFLGTSRARSLAPWLVDVAVADSQAG